MSNFTMPPTGFGPGSQPLDDQDDKLDYMPLPQDMRTYAPHLPDVEIEDETYGPALALLKEVAAACLNIGTTAEFDLSYLDVPNRALIAETLGEGEVAAKIWGVPALAVQESVFAGVWCISGAGVDRVDVAPVPPCVTADPFAPRRAAQGNDTPMQPGVQNAPPLLVELLDKSAAFTKEAELHVINLTLLPHTEPDLLWLDAALGEGSVTLLSRGYGNCRVSATAVRNVWRVQFFNSMDTLILDTFEVTHAPEVVLAAEEDLIDSGNRIISVLEAIT
ncbi:hydrogenase expression/formation protein [uncultured Roseovarius sp.]|uniref:hydrogenase expression/formation protein n=1 Tax=uncultured Roseovarius sp. TaxID=293344 RepID=UPI00263676DD|nr:hydrogenase expression/formation protein [uncultured Roseovarius sp.]